VWLKIEPLLRPEVNEARDKRLLLEGKTGYLVLRNWLLLEYSKFLKTLSPILLALAPSVIRFMCGNQALADALALSAGESLRSRYFEEISKLETELETRKKERASHLRLLLSKTDSFIEDARDDRAITLATSIYECDCCPGFFSGLHMLAHDCSRQKQPGTFHPQLNDRGRETVKMLLQILRLGEETSTIDLDRRDDIFVCTVIKKRGLTATTP
jgi:hypothetical protein